MAITLEDNEEFIHCNGNTITQMTDDDDIIKIENKQVIITDIGRIVKGESNSNLITFLIDRFEEGVDLSTKTIKFICKVGRKFYERNAVNVYKSEKHLKFTFLPDSTVTSEGTITCAIMFIGYNEFGDQYILKTKPFIIEIDDSLDTSNLMSNYNEDWYIALVSDFNRFKQEVYNILDNNRIDGTAETTSYTNETLGDDVENVEDALNKIVSKLYYVVPKINSFTMTPSTTNYEIGTTVPSLNFAWSLNKEIESQTLTGCEIDVNSRSAEYTTAITSNKTFTLTVDDGENRATASKTINFYNKKYYGASTVPSEYNSDFLLGLSNKDLVSNKNGNITVNATDNKYIFFAIPTSFGTPKFTIGGFEGGFEKVATIAFTNASGYTTDYNIYKSTNANLGNTNITIS